VQRHENLLDAEARDIAESSQKGDAIALMWTLRRLAPNNRGLRVCRQPLFRISPLPSDAGVQRADESVLMHLSAKDVWKHTGNGICQKSVAHCNVSLACVSLRDGSDHTVSRGDHEPGLHSQDVGWNVVVQHVVRHGWSPRQSS
jgi:hypothetical protein